MKRLNKKGFTLVELLAVVVILAILIAVVAGTAIPAMNSAKVKALNTYAERLSAKAKEKCMLEKIGEVDTSCTYPSPGKEDGIEEIMGEKNSQYSLSSAITVTIDENGYAKIDAGEVEDQSGNKKDITEE